MTLPDPQSLPRRSFRMPRTVMALILREMASTYGRSPGGYLWAILEPVAGIALLSVVFQYIIRSPSIGSNFPLFFASGILPFLLFMQLSNLVALALKYAGPFLAYPAVTFLDALLARFILNALTTLLVMFLVLAGIILGFNITVILNGPALFNAIGMALSLALGIGVLNCYLFERFAVWHRAWTIAMRPMFIISAIFYIPENVPARFLDIFMLNPLPHITTEMRRGIYATYDGVHVNSLYVYMIALVTMTLGMILLLRNHKDLAEL